MRMSLTLLFALIVALPAHATAPSKLVLQNQFGEVSINVVQGSVFPVAASGNVIVMTGATAPTSGGSGTGDNIAGKGSFYVAQDTGALYLQVGAITAPSWSLVNAGNASVTGALLTGYVSGAGTVGATDTLLVGINKLNGNQVLSKATADAALPSASFTDAAVTAKLITGYSSSAGSVAGTDTILVALNKLNGNQVLSKATADAALPSASFTDAAVTSKLLTGLAGGANSTILSTDTILQALAKLQAQIDAL